MHCAMAFWWGSSLWALSLLFVCDVPLVKKLNATPKKSVAEPKLCFFYNKVLDSPHTRVCVFSGGGNFLSFKRKL